MGIAAREAGEDIDVFDKDGIMDRASSYHEDSALHD